MRGTVLVLVLVLVLERGLEIKWGKGVDSSSEVAALGRGIVVLPVIVAGSRQVKSTPPSATVCPAAHSPDSRLPGTPSRP